MLHMFAVHYALLYGLCSVLNLCTAKYEVAVMANAGFGRVFVIIYN